jgi:hypothetical protein
MVPKNSHITARHVLYCASAAENLAAEVFAAADIVFAVPDKLDVPPKRGPAPAAMRPGAVRVFLSSTAAAD